MFNLILFGAPGSGKGTQAPLLVQKYGLIHISTGDLFRHEIQNKTPLGLAAKAYMDKGNLVPDSVTIGMLRNKVEAHPTAAGFIFDGFPRTVPQAEALDALLASMNSQIDLLLEMEVADELLIERILSRGKTSKRADDQNESTIKTRLQNYNNETLAVATYYNSFGKSRKIDGIGSIEEIFSRLCATIAPANVG